MYERKRYKITVIVLSLFLFFFTVFLLLCIQKIHNFNIDSQETAQMLKKKNEDLSYLREDKKRMEAELETLRAKSLDADSYRLKVTSNHWEEKANFLDKHIVLTVETGKRYHRYDCYHIKNKGFYAYNVNNAAAQGYTPCLDCNPPKATN